MDILNDLRPKQILLLAGGVAVIMFTVVYFALNSVTKTGEIVHIEETKPANMTSVVVASANIAPRAMIKENMLQLKEIPNDSLPEGAITDIASVINIPAKVAIFSGDIITKQKIYKNTEQSSFIGTIPADCRAISIGVSDVTGVDGFAKPGDYVDLLLVEHNDTSATTNVLLQNVLLLSINANMSNTAAEGENPNTTAISNPSIATFALRPEEALKLISASKLGEIYLMLRPLNPKDVYVDNMDYTAVSTNALQKSEAPAPAYTPVQVPVSALPQVTATVPPKPVTNTPTPTTPMILPDKQKKIEIIQGDQIIQK